MLQSVLVPDVGPSVPHSDGGGKDRLNYCHVELNHHHGWLLELPSLLGLFNEGTDGRIPLQVLGDDGSPESKNITKWRWECLARFRRSNEVDSLLKSTVTFIVFWAFGSRRTEISPMRVVSSANLISITDLWP